LLSVSHKYLALEEVYLPFRAAVPSNPTLGNLAYGEALAEYGSITLFAVPFQGLMLGLILLQNSLDYNSMMSPPQILTVSFWMFTRRY